MKKKNKKRVISQILILLLMLACATVFTFSFIKIIEWYRDNRATESVIDQAQKDANLSENLLEFHQDGSSPGRFF